jgi:hypothetical protein
MMATYSKNPWNPWNPWISYMTFSHIIAGWWFFATPLNKKKKSVDSQYMENKCSKPPTRLDIIFQPFHQTGVRDGKLAPRAPATSRSTRVSTLDALDGIEATCFVEDNTERMTICIVLMGFPCYSRYNL